MRMVSGLKPVDSSIIGNPPEVPIFEILSEVRPNKITLSMIRTFYRFN